MAEFVKFDGKEIPPEVADAIVAGTLIEGAVVSEWWRRQSNDFLDRFMDEIRTSMNNGESVTQAVTRIAGGTVAGEEVPGIMRTTKKKAGALVSTAINAVTTEARIRTFQENSDVVKGIQQVSTLDNKTSDICIAYSGQAWDVQTLRPLPGSSLPFNGGTPRHFNCRSTLVPVTKSFKELGIDAPELPVGTRASMDGQVPGDISFDQWLKGKSQSFQNSLLGPARARLWRDKKITLTQLVDMRGNPLTLDQLEEKIRGRRRR